MKTSFWILFIFIMVGCNQKSTENNESDRKDIQLALTQKLEASKVEVILLPEAQEITNEWLAYITAQSEIENLKNYTLNDVIANTTPITEIMKSLQETVPVSLQSNAVKARLGVLVTKSKILQQLAEKREVDPEKISKTAKELPQEWNNFKIQINELFLKTLEEFEEELDEIENEEEQSPKRVLPASRKRTVGNNRSRDSIL
jgi:prephenate dehydrogenase